MIGIIVAIPEELNSIKSYMKNIKVNSIYETEFYVGTIGSKNCVLTQCGVGKVNAARTTQLLIDKYNPEFIINIGVAGGISSKAKIGDIIIAEKLVQHDFDLTAFGREKGEISDKVGKFIYSDKQLVQKAKNILDNNNDIKAEIGTIASGDIFVTDIEQSKNINKEFQADCIEMEGASIAQVCFLDKVSFIVIRSISDSPNDNNKVDYETFLHKASKNVAYFVNELLSERSK